MSSLGPREVYLFLGETKVRPRLGTALLVLNRKQLDLDVDSILAIAKCNVEMCLVLWGVRIDFEIGFVS